VPRGQPRDAEHPERGAKGRRRPLTYEFNLPRLERVISGAHTINRLGAELDRLGAARIVIVTGRTLAASALLEPLTRAIGDRLVCVFADARQHVPSSTVADLVRLVQRERANGLVSFGGGSPIDTAKAAAFTMLSAAGDDVSHIAVPTTLSAGEFTAVAGVTNEQTRVKRPLHDARISPRVVITDPVLTLETPDWLWAGTAMRAVDHAVEAIYSARHHPVGETMASRALALLLEHLQLSIRTTGERRLEHRLQCQMAAWLAVFGMTNAGFGLSHALGHQIGPRWNVPHGFTSCITLPHAMRFMADRVPERFGPIAAGLGLPFDVDRPRDSAHACADRVQAFIAQFEVPHRLHDAHVPRHEVGDIAAVVRDAMEEAGAVSQPITIEEITAVLAAAY
jgi:maleylacetate reductase